MKLNKIINKIKLLLPLTLLLLSLTGCGETITINVENTEGISSNVIGKSALIYIGDSLYYDSSTRIVYWWNGYLSYTQCDTTPTPYYAPNGLPYRYNPETNTFEEIEKE